MSQPDRPDKHGDDDAQLAEFGELLGNLRAGTDDDLGENPPPSVWAGIEASLASSNAPSSEALSYVAPSSLETDNEPASLDAARDQRASREKMGRRAAVLVAVAAAILLVAVPVGLSLRGTSEELVAQASLEPLSDSAAGPGQAELRSTDEDLWIALEATASSDGGDFLELWILEVDGSGAPTGDMVSLGRIEGTGDYDVPDDLDTDRYTVVDVSIEADDGIAAHSGNSVLRGPLKST